MKFIFALLLLISSAAFSQRYSIRSMRVKLSPNYTTNVLLALPPGYDSLAHKYPVVYVGKGLGESYSGVQNSGVFRLLRDGFIPDKNTPFVFVHIDQGSTTWIDYIAYTTDQLINVHKVAIDIDNSFITGHSAGGGYAASAQFGRNGSIADATIIGKRFRGIVAQAANQDTREDNWQAAAQLQIPMWVICGANDQLAYINRAQRIYDNTKDKTFCELLLRSGVGHGGWDAVYNGTVKMENGKTMWQFFSSNLLIKPTDNTPYIIQEVVLKLNLGVLKVYSDGTYTISTL